MSGGPLVSVVVPVYDRVDPLARALDSVLAQTVADLEVVVVDDGSTAPVADLVEGYEDPRVRYRRHPENRGVSAARNTGLDAARGDHVAFLDSDDVWRPAKLERQLDRLAAAGDDAVAVYCDAVTHRSDALTGAVERLVPGRVGAEGGEELVPAVLAMRVAFNPGSTLLVCGDVARDLRFDERFAMLEDLDYLLGVLRAGRLVCVDEPLVDLYETGYAAVETEERARTAFLDKHDETVAALERAGHPVTAVHEFFLAKAYFRAGRFGAGLARLRRATVPDVRQLAALAWSASVGLRPGSA